MKKKLALLLILCLSLTILSPTALAATAQDGQSVEKTILALGIMTGDPAGNLNLSNNVTRAEFCKMMVMASTYKDTATGATAVSPFKDVKNTHWAAGYIDTAVTAGWFVGYVDGTFRPQENITLEQASACILRLLGYTSSSFTGSYPQAYLTKFVALGLNKGVSKVQGECLTREDCMHVFYNLMGVKTESGKIYATTLGYTVNSAGELDYTAIVNAGIKGPYVVSDSGWAAQLPFDAGSATVFLNGRASGVSAISAYDVFYYNGNIHTVWVYSNRVTGVYTAATPGTASPASVTVAGNSYTVGTSDAAYKLSNMGEFKLGDVVTLLLGKDGDIADVLPADKINTVEYGVVVSCGNETYTGNSGLKEVKNTVTVTCTDGITRKYVSSVTTFKRGDIVTISSVNGAIDIRGIGSSSIYGTVDTQGTQLGSRKFAPDVEILDADKNGDSKVIYPERLAGLTLADADVLFYALDDRGCISRLILNNATGDVGKYGVITSSQEVMHDFTINASYSYLINGTAGTFTSASTMFNVQAGPAVFSFDSAGISGMKNLSGTALKDVNQLYAISGSNKYKMSEDVQIYQKQNNNYYLSNLTAVNDSKKFTLTGYCDRCSAGGRIRVIIAEALPQQ